MEVKRFSKTRIAFFILLLHLLYAALFAVFMLIACLLEDPCNRGGIYIVFSVISIVLLCLYPLEATFINAGSVVFQVWALKENESRLQNVIMMVITVLYEIAVIILFVLFWQGAMSV